MIKTTIDFALKQETYCNKVVSIVSIVVKK